MIKRIKFLLPLLIIGITFVVNIQIGNALSLKFSSIDLTMSFKDDTLPMKGNIPVTSLKGTFKNMYGTEVCNEISIVKWQKRQYIDDPWIDINQNFPFQEGYYYKPVFGTCTSNFDTYSIDANSTTIKVNSGTVDEYSAENGIYKNWVGFRVDDTILVKSIYETVIEPKVGNKPSTTIDVIIDPISAYKVDKINIVWLESLDGKNWKEMKKGSLFESGKYYLSEGVAGDYLSEGYVVSKSLSSSVINTGLDITEFSDYYLNNNLLTELWKIYGPIYSYKFLDGSSLKEVNEGNIKELSFRVDCGIDLFEKISIGGIKLINEEDYKLFKGSTIITLTNKGLAKINKLKSGSYEVKISFNNGEEPLIGKIVVKNQLDINNPNTGDNIFLYIVIGVISLFGIVGMKFYCKKNN